MVNHTFSGDVKSHFLYRNTRFVAGFNNHWVAICFGGHFVTENPFVLCLYTGADTAAALYKRSQWSYKNMQNLIDWTVDWSNKLISSLIIIRLEVD